MMDTNQVTAAFPELSNIRRVDTPSGQKFVFLALRDNAAVVLKIIRPYRGAHERADREILAGNILGSSYVPTILDHGVRHIGGCEMRYIVESFVNGETLERKLADQPVQPLDFVLRLTYALLCACKDFEAVSIVHRDIKPGNLIIAPDGKVWVIDFGIARHLEMPSLTGTGGSGLGTWGYAAPEQFRNMKSNINGRADLFSVGIVAYEAMTGGHPFARYTDNPLVLLRKMEGEDIPPPALSMGDDGRFADFICQLARRYPSRRPQTANDALAWFEPIYNDLRNRKEEGSAL